MGHVFSTPPTPPRFEAYYANLEWSQIHLICAVWKNWPDQVIRRCPYAIKSTFGSAEQDTIRWALWLAMKYKLTAAADALIRWCKENDRDKCYIRLLNRAFHFVFETAQCHNIPMLRYMVQQLSSETMITHTTMCYILMDDPSIFIHDFIRYPTQYWYRVFDLHCWRIAEWIVVKGYKKWDDVSSVERDIISKAFRAYSAARRIQRIWRHHRDNCEKTTLGTDAQPICLDIPRNRTSNFGTFRYDISAGQQIQ